MFTQGTHAQGVFPINRAEVAALERGGASGGKSTAVPNTLTNQHVNSLQALAPEEFAVFSQTYMCTYEVRRAYAAAELLPRAVDVLPGVTAAVVYDYALSLGVPVLGLAPAHTRRGKWTVAIEGNPPRVYGGPSKLPYEAATKFSPPPSKHS
jgi:hypothetical protein